MVRCHAVQQQTDTISGLCGVVLIVDPATEMQVRRLAGQSANMSVRTELPHLSLYHVDLDEVPRRAVTTVLQSIRDVVRNTPIRLEELAVFGDRFVFWDAAVTLELRAAHEAALELAPFRRVDGGKSSAAGIGLDLTPEQIANDRDFGYVFVKRLFRPHVTIGYYDHAVEAPEVAQPALREAGVAAVALYELGNHGRIVTPIEQLPVFDRAPGRGAA